MRDIKFRAWNVDDEIMLYSDFNAMGFYSLENAQEIAENTETVFMYHAYTGDKDFVLLQYTGLKDINGVEIYEGDIVHIEGASGFISRAIKFERGTFHFGYIDDGMCDYREMRVVGNIYENPELLTESEETR